jgi:putative ABC transport system ATP-binding protein
MLSDGPEGGSDLDSQPVFELSRVSVTRNGKQILKGIDWRVRAGQVSIVLGPTGSGKTSLLRLLNRLDDPSSGEIRYMGRPASSAGVSDLRREVGMVLQQPFLFEGTVLDNILYGVRIHGLDVDVAEITSLVGISEVMLAQNADTLSVGQSQKVSIARAVALKPRVLLLDEPTSGLDPTSTLQIEELLSGLVSALELTCVFVTHHIEQARRLGHRGILIVDGAVVEEGGIEEMLSSPSDERTRKFMKGELR